jgi:hypothetical protein
LPGPATERVGSPETERVSSQSGANWLTGVAPLDTAAPTTLPTFLRRRQTELKIGLPLLAALVLAAVLFRVLRPAGSHTAAAPVDEVIPVQHVDTTPAPAAPSVRPMAPGAAPQAPGVAPVAPAQAPGVAPVAPVLALPASSSQSAQPAAAPSTAPPQAAPSAPEPAVQAEPSPSEPRPARGSAPKRRRPSLKQIGIEQ